MSGRAEYELVPSTDDPNAQQLVEKEKKSLVRTRRSKLIVLALVLVLLLSALYRFWFRDTPVDRDDGHLPEQDSKQGATTSTTSDIVTKPTQKPSEGSGEGGNNKMPAGKYSVG